MSSHPNSIRQIRHWINRVVVGLNLCPFAARTLDNDSLVLQAVDGDTGEILESLAALCQQLERQPELDTALLVIEKGFTDFDDYLDLVYLAELLLEDLDYAGVFQLATFHPDYQFSGTESGDAANYSNRSPFPVLQLLRESSVSQALENYAYPEEIPHRNEQRLRELGVDAIRSLLAREH